MALGFLAIAVLCIAGMHLPISDQYGGWRTSLAVIAIVCALLAALMGFELIQT